MDRKILIVAVCAVFLTPMSAYAYVDPGTGSLILQVVIAAIVGALFTLKMYWRRLSGFFRGNKPPVSQDKKGMQSDSEDQS